MITITSLRELVDYQQFAELKLQALYFIEHDIEGSANNHAANNNQVWSLLALAYAHLSERTLAEEACQQAEIFWLSVKGNQIDSATIDDALTDLAGVYCLFLRVDEATTLLKKVIKNIPEHSLALARLAWCRMYDDQLKEARLLYEQSVAISPQRISVWSGLSRVCIELEELDVAQQALDEGIKQFKAHFDSFPTEVATQFTAQFRTLQLENWVKAGAAAEAEAWLQERCVTLTEEEWVPLVIAYSQLLVHHSGYDEAEEALKMAGGHYPENLLLLSRLAYMAESLGRTQQAIQAYRRCISISEKKGEPSVSYWVQLSSVCLHSFLGMSKKAATNALEKADKLVESDDLSELQIKHMTLQAKNAMAQVESQEQNFEVARTLFQEILDEAAYFLPALQGLGQMEMQCGHLDTAIALFERVKQTDPAKGYSSLISARQFPEDEKTLERMEKLGRKPSMEGKVQSGLLLQVATAWEKRKDYDKAFKLAIDANNATLMVLDYDANEHRNSCARIRYAFSQSLYAHRNDYEMDSTLPVFVLGMPRSGTTLIEQIISGHSDIFGAGELGIIPSRIQGLNRWERHVGSNREYPDCIDDVSPYVRKGIADGMLDELKALAKDSKPNAKHIIDKLPHNFENIGMIKFFFPKAKIISVRRDPRDIAISNYFTDYQAKHGGMGFAYSLPSIGEQLADHNLLMHHWNEVFPGEILEVNYEDVVQNTEQVARRILEYIGVDWQPEVLNFNKLERAVKTASVWQVRQPIYKTAIEKWRRYEAYLTPLIEGTNALIRPDDINDMVTLPSPGLLHSGVAHYQDKEFDKAEYDLKLLLHYLPEHAAANFMVGLVYIHKGHLTDAIPFMEKGQQKCPWNKQWRADLIQAYKLTDNQEKADELKAKYAQKGDDIAADQEQEEFDAFADIGFDIEQDIKLSKNGG